MAPMQGWPSPIKIWSRCLTTANFNKEGQLRLFRSIRWYREQWTRRTSSQPSTTTMRTPRYFWLVPSTVLLIHQFNNQVESCTNPNFQHSIQMRPQAMQKVKRETIPKIQSVINTAKRLPRQARVWLRVDPYSEKEMDRSSRWTSSHPGNIILATNKNNPTPTIRVSK